MQPALAQDCSNRLVGIGGDDCLGKNYEVVDFMTRRLLTHRTSPVVTFESVPFHPHFLSMFKPVTQREAHNSLTPDPNAEFYVSVSADFRTGKFRLTMTGATNVVAFEKLPRGKRPDDVTRFRGNAREAEIEEGALVLIKNRTGHVALVKIHELEVSDNVHAFSQELDQGQAGCKRAGEYDEGVPDLGVEPGWVCTDALRLAIRYDAWIQLVHGSSDFTGIEVLR